jgi:hypothetical protein
MVSRLCIAYKLIQYNDLNALRIGAMANVDKRLISVLQKISHRSWAYGSPNDRSLLTGQSWQHSLCQACLPYKSTDLASDLGYPSSWGDPMQLPVRGGPLATKTWEQLGVKGRIGVGGIPCELVHGRVGRSIIPGGIEGSCTGNALMRAAIGFMEGLALYAPVI